MDLEMLKMSLAFQMAYTSEVMCLVVKAATVTYSPSVFSEPRRLSALQMDHLDCLL